MTDNTIDSEADEKLVIFGWMTTILGIPKKADPTKYNELTDKLYELFNQWAAQEANKARLDELAEIKKLADYSAQYHTATHAMYEVYQWVEKRLAALTADKEQADG